jgi:hypothetical protein
MKLVITISLLFISFLSYAQDNEMNEGCYIFIQNNLTRNDGAELVLSTNCTFEKFKFEIFDKWGELMFETTKFSNPIDFNLNEKIIVDGKDQYKYEINQTYTWVVTYSLKNHKEKMRRIGRIMIL